MSVNLKTGDDPIISVNYLADSGIVLVCVLSSNVNFSSSLDVPARHNMRTDSE